MRAKKSCGLLLILLIILSLYQCKQNQSVMLRFIDDLTQENIIISPLISLEKNAHPVEQKWKGKDMSELNWGDREVVPFEIPEKARTFVFPTENSIVAWKRNLKPDGMEVFLDGNKVDFSNVVFEDKVSWKWIRLDTTIEPEVFRKWYKVYQNFIVLEREKFFTHEFLFPGGEVFFEVTVRSVDPFDYLPHLYLFVDDAARQRFIVGKNRKYWVNTDIDPGLHTVKIGFYDVTQKLPDNQVKKVLLDTVSIRSQNDAILVTIPEDKIDQFSDASLQANYLSMEDRKIFKEKPLLKPLKHKEYFERVVHLEQGISYLNVICSSNDMDVYIQVWLDDDEIGNHKITPLEEQPYLFEIPAEEGNYKLKLQMKYWPSENKTISYEPELYIHRFYIKGPFEDVYLPLFQMRDQFLLYDAGINENPYGIKKKLRIDEENLNCIFSPSQSEFVFDHKVAENDCLEFGCGLIKRAKEVPGDGVDFIVKIEDSHKKETLFSRYVDPRSSEYKKYSIVRTSINLTPYKGKKVKFRLITQNSPDSMDNRNDLAYWINPVIYRNEPSQEYNVILISLDTLRSDRLGCYGYERNTTPNIDILAKESVLFSQCFSQAPYTITSHVSMLTGLWPVNHGTYSTTYHKLNKSIITLADLLRLREYFTGAFTGGGAMSAFFGYSKGFDFYNERRENVQGDTARKIFQLSADWIRKNKEKKFFLFIHTYQIHSPYEPPPPYDEMFTAEDAPYRKSSDIHEFQGWWGEIPDNIRENVIALYDGEIRYTDEALIGPLMALLRELDIYDRSMIVVTSDHGEEFYEHKGWGHSHTLYNELIKVPLVIKFPKNKFAGKKVDTLVRSVDIMPTILEMLGVNLEKDILDGESLLSLIHGDEVQDRVFFSELKYQDDFPDKISSNLERNKLILNEPFTEEQLSRFMIPPPKIDKEELYDLRTDPQEKLNMVADEQGLFNRIAKQIAEYSLKAKMKEKELDKQELDEKVIEQLKALGYIK